MISATVAKEFLAEDSPAYEWVSFFGSSILAMAIALVAAIYFFGIRQGHTMEWTINVFESAVKGIAMVVLIIGAGGALKQVIIDSRVGDYIGSLMTATSVSPPHHGVGHHRPHSTGHRPGRGECMTAAGIISAALLDPVNGTITAVNPALLVVATAAGSNTLTHVNDASFWLFKGYFDLSVKDTLKTWGLLQLSNSIVGLVVVMGLSLVV